MTKERNKLPAYDLDLRANHVWSKCKNAHHSLDSEKMCKMIEGHFIEAVNDAKRGDGLLRKSIQKLRNEVCALKRLVSERNEELRKLKTPKAQKHDHQRNLPDVQETRRK